MYHTMNEHISFKFLYKAAQFNAYCLDYALARFYY